jgi:hypothetical protein
VKGAYAPRSQSEFSDAHDKLCIPLSNATAINKAIMINKMEIATNDAFSRMRQFGSKTNSSPDFEYSKNYLQRSNNILEMCRVKIQNML